MHGAAGQWPPGTCLLGGETWRRACKLSTSRLCALRLATSRRVQATFVRRTLKGQVSKYRSRVHEAEAAAASSRERAAAAEREAAARRLESEAAETRASRLTSHLQTSADAASKAADNLHRSGPHTPAVAEAIAVLDALRQGVADASGSDRGQSSERWGPGSRRVRSANAPGQAPRAKRRRDRSASASVYDGNEDALAGQPGAANRQPAGKRALSSSSESCHAIAHYRRWQPVRSQWFRAGRARARVVLGLCA